MKCEQVCVLYAQNLGGYLSDFLGTAWVPLWGHLRHTVVMESISIYTLYIHQHSTYMYMYERREYTHFSYLWLAWIVSVRWTVHISVVQWLIAHTLLVPHVLPRLILLLLITKYFKHWCEKLFYVWPDLLNSRQSIGGVVYFYSVRTCMYSLPVSNTYR